MPSLLLGLLLFAGIGLERAAQPGISSPDHLAAVIREAKTVVIGFENFRDKRRSTDAVIEDRAWIEKLATLAADGPLIRMPYCFCVSTPTVELYGDDGLLLKLTLHHNSKMRCFGRIKGDFDIGETRARAILALLVAQESNARERFVPKLKWPATKR
mgnify:CR=1 FL=1